MGQNKLTKEQIWVFWKSGVSEWKLSYQLYKNILWRYSNQNSIGIIIDFVVESERIQNRSWYINKFSIWYRWYFNSNKKTKGHLAQWFWHNRPSVWEDTKFNPYNKQHIEISSSWMKDVIMKIIHSEIWYTLKENVCKTSG